MVVSVIVFNIKRFNLIAHSNVFSQRKEKIPNPKDIAECVEV